MNRLSLLLILALFGCANTKTPNQSTKTTPRAPGLPTADEMAQHSEWFACEASSDCGYQELGCCDSCNGGFGVVMNNTFTKDAKAAWGAVDCSERNEQGCSLRGCELPTASCTEGRCVARVE